MSISLSAEGGGADENGLDSPVVLANITHQRFAQHARKGYPLLVTDWARNMTYNGWTCKDFADHFPFGYMKAEYIEHMPGFNPRMHDIRIMDGERRFNMGNFKPDGNTMWYNFSRPASPRYGDDPLKPSSGPYVWHVKDELPPSQKKLVQQRFEAPSFLSDPLNKAWMNRTFEIWFSPGTKTGAGAHNDGYCESVVSFQLNGDKKWRKMMMPEMSFLDSFDEFDGGVYSANKWDPDIGYVNSRSSAAIWPPGYLHETNTLPTSDGSCQVSVTVQYAFPQPVQFIRAYLPRLSLSSEVGQCVAGSWNGYASFFVPGIYPSADTASIRIQHERVLEHLDANHDGSIDVPETISWFEKSGVVDHQAEYYGTEHTTLFYSFKAEDTVAYHDMDGDMIASSQELLDSLVQWNVVRTRIKHGLDLINKGQRAQLEEFERSLDPMRRKPITIPDSMRPELEEVFQIREGQRIFDDLESEGVHSLTDMEFYSRLQDRLAGSDHEHDEM